MIPAIAIASADPYMALWQLTCSNMVTIGLGVCSNRVGFCRTCIALLAVGVMFVVMYMFIRVTYFIGYKS